MNSFYFDEYKITELSYFDYKQLVKELLTDDLTVLNDKIRIQTIGKNIKKPNVPAIKVLRVFVLLFTERAMNSPYASRFFPIILIKKIATILAKIIAMTPQALPIPTSNCNSEET